MTYEEFKKDFRYEYPNATCRLIKEMHQLVYPGPKDITATEIEDRMNTIASCKPAMPVKQGWFRKSQYSLEPYNNQEGEKPMCKYCTSQSYNTVATVTSAPVSIEATQRDFATARVNQIREKHDEQLRKQFFIDSDLQPQTARDLIKAIKEDEFTLDEKKLTKLEDALQYYGPFTGILWGKNKPDEKGYDAARKALKEESQEVIDAITLAPIEKAREVLDTFKDWTYTV